MNVIPPAQAAMVAATIASPTALFGWARPGDRVTQGQEAKAVLAEMGVSADLQTAALILPRLWQHDAAIDELEREGGLQAAAVGRAYRELLDILAPIPEGKIAPIRQLVHLYVGAYADLRLALLAAAYLWSDFLTIRQSPAILQTAPALDASLRQVLIPYLEMLGLWELRTRAIQWLVENGKEGDKYRQIQEKLASTDPLRARAFAAIQTELAPRLGDAHLASGYRPPYRSLRLLSHDDVLRPEQFDRLRVEVQVADSAACYQTLHWIHQLWRPAEGGLADYIGSPQLSGYRCLHTSASIPVASSYVRADFRICTSEMDQVNCWGIATMFQDGAGKGSVRGAWWEGAEIGFDHIRSARIGASSSPLYVFSPQGQLITLPEGAAAVDFAYYVHSELANRTQRFLVNGEAVAPGTPLHHLDLVELRQDPFAKGPTQAWLSAAATSRARTRVKQFLKQQGGKEAEGRQAFEASLHQLERHYGLRLSARKIEERLADLAQRKRLADVDELYVEIAARRVAPEKILHDLFAEEIARNVERADGIQMQRFQISVGQCCRPQIGASIVGDIRRRHGEAVGVKIHTADCPNRPQPSESIEMAWRRTPAASEMVTLEIEALDDHGLLGWVLNQVYVQAPQVNLLESHATARYGRARIAVTVEAQDENAVDAVVARLRASTDFRVSHVERLRPDDAIIDHLASATSPHSYNPYGRLPVATREMFFGRRDELDQVTQWLQDRADVIFLEGTKRVGKTSLLRYLKRDQLDTRQFAPAYIDFRVLGGDLQSSFFETASSLHDTLTIDDQIGHLKPPLRDLFADRPAAQFCRYVATVQEHVAPRHLVLLVDEFSRMLDAASTRPDLAGFVEQWLGVVQATAPTLSYIFTIHPSIHDGISRLGDDGAVAAWRHLLGLGHTLVMHPFPDSDAKELILTPVRNRLDYTPAALAHLVRLAGGSPYLINVLCFELVRIVSRRTSPTIDLDDVESVATLFMSPEENLFRHIEEGLKGVSSLVCAKIADLSAIEGQPVALATLQRSLPKVPEDTLRRTLQFLSQRHIVTGLEDDHWQMTSLLFCRWLSLQL